jgi:predicted GNAT superfamily acetyltransferase
MPPAPEPVTLRRVATLAEYAECVAIQYETWGADFTEAVPAAILMVSQKVGGVTAGAFAPDGRMLGFVFGLTGVKGGRLVHWSDMLAVRGEARGLGLGTRLKYYQRDLLRETGVELMYWTFDPLVARNAHLNLVRLGARVAEYVPDMYGGSTGSVLHGELGTDRCVVEWELADDPTSAAAGYGLRAAGDVPVVNAADHQNGRPRIAALPDAPEVLVEIPADLEALLAHDPRRARDWRETTREAFTWYLGRGFHVAGLAESDGRTMYVLRRGASSQPVPPASGGHPRSPQ